MNAKEGMPILKLQEQTTAKTIVEYDHQILQCYTDYTYFGKEYVKRWTKKGHKLPKMVLLAHHWLLTRLND